MSPRYAFVAAVVCSCAAPAPWPGGQVVYFDSAPPDPRKPTPHRGRPDASAVDGAAAADAAPDAAADAPEGTAHQDAPVCPAGWGECSPGACLNLATTAAHCGACGYACPSHARCERGECLSPSGLSCERGRADCDNNIGSGCESHLRVAHTNCGACGNDCTARMLFCREGVCAP